MRLDYPFDIGDLRGLPVSSLLSDCKPGRGHQVESDAVSEWSKELALGASPVRVAGSNPVRIRPFFLYTPSCILSCLSSTSSCQSTIMRVNSLPSSSRLSIWDTRYRKAVTIAIFVSRHGQPGCRSSVVCLLSPLAGAQHEAGAPCHAAWRPIAATSTSTCTRAGRVTESTSNCPCAASL